MKIAQNLINKNGVVAKWVTLSKKCDIGGDYILHTTVGDIVVYSNFFDEPNWMYYNEIKKRFVELSEGCQNWLLELVKLPYKNIGDENPLIKKLDEFYYEITWTGINRYSSWNKGICINDVRYYLVNEGIGKIIN